MKKKIKQQLIKALESGDYKHGRMVLQCSNGTFCCIGVLCDLHAKRTGRKWEDQDRLGMTYLGRNDRAPLLVRQWAGLTRAVEDDLININDATTSYSSVIRYLKAEK